MRHQKAFRKFGRSSSHRRALFRNLTTSLLEHGRIETTVAKAKDLRRVSEKLITLAGEDTLHRRRQALSYILKKDVVHKLFDQIGPQFKARPGGYTRITRTRVRAGDATEMAIIELVTEDYSPGKGAKKSRKSKSTEASEKKSSPKAEAKEATSKEESPKKETAKKSPAKKKTAKDKAAE